MSSFNVFPYGWEVKEIKDTNIAIIDGDRGQNYPAKDEFSSDGFCLFLNTGNIVNDSFDLTSCDFISEKKDALLRKGKLLRKDIVLTTRGTVGSIAYYNANIKYEHVRINSGMVIIRCGEELSPQYIYHLLKSPLLKSQYLLYSSGAAQPQLPIKDLRRIKLPIPKLKIQKKIAAVLSAYDDLIENNKQRIVLLEKIAEEIYREWFMRMRFPKHEMIKFEKGVPESWIITKLGDVLELCYGKALKESARVPGDFLVYGSSGIVGTHNEAIVNHPGIVVGRKGNVGSVHWSDRGFYPIDTVYYVKSKISSYFLFFLLQSVNFLNNDAAVPGLNRNQAYSNKFLLPDEPLIEEFSRVAESIFAMKHKLTENNEVLKTTKNMLLSRLLAGKLSVQNLNIQFPPSMLAETEGKPTADDVKEAAYA